MDFLVCGGFSPSTIGLKDLICKSTLERASEIYSAMSGRLAVLATDPPVLDGQTILLFDGTAIVGREFLNCHDTLRPETLRSLGNRAQDASGTFVLGEISPDGSFRFQVDGVAAYHLWYYNNQGLFAVSNNLYFVEVLLRAEGASSTRTVRPFIGKLFWDAPHRLGSGSPEIPMLGPRQMLEGGQQLQIKRTSNLREAYLPGLTYDEAISEASAQIERNVRAVCDLRFGGQSFYDVTGGRDSRMVFAALKKNGLHRTMPYHCIRRFPHPDGNYAALLAERYGLTPFDHPDPPGELPLVLDSELVYYDVFPAMAMAVGDGHLQNVSNTEVLHIHGGYGEFGGRSPDAKRCSAFHPGLTARGLASVYSKKVGYAPFLTRDASAYFTNLTTEWFEQIAEEVGLMTAIPLVFYNEGKARSHFGFISKFRGRKKRYPDVLHVRWLSVAGIHLSVSEQAAAKVNFDVIRRLGGEDLLALPLADAAWAMSIVPADLAGKVGNQSPITQRSSALYQDVRWGKYSRSSFRIQVDKLGKDLHPGLRGVLYAQKIVQDRLTPSSELLSYLDRPTLDTLLTKPASDINGREAHVLRTAAHALIWCGREERRFLLKWPRDHTTTRASG